MNVFPKMSNYSSTTKMTPKNSPLKLLLLEMKRSGCPVLKSVKKNHFASVSLSTAVSEKGFIRPKVVKEVEHTEEQDTPSTEVRP